ncbi:MAG: ATP-binding protein [Candidatus Magnetoovum sp. WYHC-5]|nr:ATP-binding protein [Candidatus Magnetoovum sp. WYHC-5]
MGDETEQIIFIVGSEKKLYEILTPGDVTALLKAIFIQGVNVVAITDEKYKVLWAQGSESYLKALPSLIDKAKKEPQPQNNEWHLAEITHEGEPIGFFFINVSKLISPEIFAFIKHLSLTVINILIKSTIKRLLTTEIHTSAIKQSYEELTEINKKLSISEKKYKELTRQLKKVLEQRTEKLKKAYAVVLQQEKMASIGQLAAGIAHEINNPMAFIYSNLNTFEKYIGKIKQIFDLYKDGSFDEAKVIYKKLKMDFILEDIHALISQSKEGAERIKHIVSNLKDFSHIDDTSDIINDINAEIDKTIGVLHKKLEEKGVQIVKKYSQPTMLKVKPGLFCQMIMNILLNAIDSKEKDVTITIETKQLEDNVIISIADNGKGIPRSIQNRIFEPFFTTKPVGLGIGIGLTIAYKIIVQYDGKIEVQSKENEGATFIIAFPL